jgi:predicted RNA-binding protein YlxR (DUF448 family)
VPSTGPEKLPDWIPENRSGGRWSSWQVVGQPDRGVEDRPLEVVDEVVGDRHRVRLVTLSFSRVRISGSTPVECWPVVPQLDISTRTDGPIRTCIGCRAQTTKRELLRIVAETDAEGQEGSQPGSWFVAPDPSGTAPGRGAHLHPTAQCFALAERKRAFSRALRHDAVVRGALNLERLREQLGQTEQEPTAAPTKNGSASS